MINDVMMMMTDDEWWFIIMIEDSWMMNDDGGGGTAMKLPNGFRVVEGRLEISSGMLWFCADATASSCITDLNSILEPCSPMQNSIFIFLQATSSSSASPPKVIIWYISSALLGWEVVGRLEKGWYKGFTFEIWTQQVHGTNCLWSKQFLPYAAAKWYVSRRK